MGTLQIELPRSDRDSLMELERIDDGTIVAQPDHFEGSTELVSVIVAITSITIPAVTALITQRIKSKQYIKVKMKGIEVSGESLKDIAKFLQDIKRD